MITETELEKERTECEREKGDEEQPDRRERDSVTIGSKPSAVSKRKCARNNILPRF